MRVQIEIVIPVNTPIYGNWGVSWLQNYGSDTP